MSCRRGDVAIARERTDQTVREGSVSSLDHAVTTVVSPVDHLQFQGGRLGKHSSEVTNRLPCAARPLGHGVDHCATLARLHLSCLSCIAKEPKQKVVDLKLEMD